MKAVSSFDIAFVLFFTNPLTRLCLFACLYTLFNTLFRPAENPVKQGLPGAKGIDAFW